MGRRASDAEEVANVLESKAKALERTLAEAFDSLKDSVISLGKERKESDQAKQEAERRKRDARETVKREGEQSPLGAQMRSDCARKIKEMNDFLTNKSAKDSEEIKEKLREATKK
jgi:cell division septum initiation protein DivIVA